VRAAPAWPRRLRGRPRRDSGCKFRLAYFRPASGLNEETRRLHAANLLAAVRQLHYSEKNENSHRLATFGAVRARFDSRRRAPRNMSEQGSRRHRGPRHLLLTSEVSAPF
jgi:hypothetical protein